MLGVVVLCICSILIHQLWLKSQTLRSKLRRQGIKGPRASLFQGNLPEMKRIQRGCDYVRALYKPTCQVSHDWVHSLFPSFKYWSKLYGPTFACSLGNVKVMYVSEHEMVKEVTQYPSIKLGKPTNYNFQQHIGPGILTSNGFDWAYHRQIVAPQLYMEKVKGMVNIVLESADLLASSWEMKIKGEGGGAQDIRIDEDLRKFSANVISQTCFGRSYSKARDIFVNLKALQQLMSKSSNNPIPIGLAGAPYFPTKNNKEMRRLAKEIRSSISKMVEERKFATGEDLLQAIIDRANNRNLTPEAANNSIVDSCNNIYFSSIEPTAMSACWTLILLASNPDWQDRIRNELSQVCTGRVPDADTLRNMKLLNMVIQESLRLYPPVALMSREALDEIKIGDFIVPKGVKVLVPVSTLHRDKSVWGADADEFKPERFANGSSGACKLPQLYLPFGAGPRTCAGQNLAMVELKILLSLLLSRFSFAVSPKYRHSPVLKFFVEPEYGANLLVQRV
ncbi:Cytochrome P450 [Dillenia turbinata]|uniref:Cytochrome P450 n=1 Tax=Dillenia turbinata TaxID=194707 RepID=A0AAN8WB81_9MAGN